MKNPWIGPLLLLGGATAALAIAYSRSAAPAPAPAPAPGQAPGPLPPNLQQQLSDLLARAASNPSQVDPAQMSAFADQLQAAGYPDQAAQVRQAAAAAAAARGGAIPGGLQIPGGVLPGGLQIPGGLATGPVNQPGT